VCPGPTATAFGGGQVPSAERKAERAKKIPLGRMVEAEDIADAVLFLAAIWHACAPVLPSMSDGGVLISNDIPYEDYFARRTDRAERGERPASRYPGTVAGLLWSS